MKLYQPLLDFILLQIVSSGTAHFNQKLKYYEVIDSYDIKHQIRRRDVDENDHVREVSFSALGRTWRLELVPKPEIFSNNFRAVAIDSKGNEKSFDFDQHEFYHGYLKGEEQSSSVTAQVNDNLLTAAIETKDDTFHIEPASGHVGGNVANKMVAYRDSDVNWNATFAPPMHAGNHTQNRTFCGLKSSKSKPTSDHGHQRSGRHRRTDKRKLKCGLVLVADYLYFLRMGQSSKTKTTHSMVGVINRVDELFKKTDWSEDDSDSYRNYGFVINKIIVHSEQSSSGYNRVIADRVWNIKPLLEEFSRRDWSEHCLAHLFTYQDFNDGVIGLAYVAYPDENSKGGICSYGERGMWYNTGLSSSINWGVQLLTTEADIVTAHEFGHNFGSEHDVQDDLECSPKTGGKFIMYPASVSGREENNKKFSRCSRRAVKKVLENKAQRCFSYPNESRFCGNFRIEAGEDCDPGTNRNDRCCTRECKLAKGAQCSSNFERPCCSDCKFANSSTICSPAQSLLCRKVSYCSGSSDRCQKPDFADEGTECIERGKCDKEGNCQPFCKTQIPPSEPCLCSNDEDACFVCCKKNNVCEVYRNNTERLPLKDGILCNGGVCRKQKCEKKAQDVITRLQDFFDTLSNPSKFGEFLKDNIVGTVIVFSLIAWIPLSILVHRIDKRRDKQAQELARWQDIANQQLIRQPKRNQDFDVVFKNNSVYLRDSRKGVGRSVSPNRRRGPTVE